MFSSFELIFAKGSRIVQSVGKIEAYALFGLISFDSLKQFPANIDQRLYSSFLDDETAIFQGDGITGLPVVNLPEPMVASSYQTLPGMIFFKKKPSNSASSEIALE